MTELIWEGKYDESGRKVAPPRIALACSPADGESAQFRSDVTDYRNRNFVRVAPFHTT
jgi:hypothetical protein